jgi:hypothetical protein
MSDSRQKGYELMETEQVERAITSALERNPRVTVPQEFAAKVAQSLPGGVPTRAGMVLKAGSVGKRLAVVAMVLLAAFLCVLAPHAATSFSSPAFDLELMVLAELGAVAWMLARMQSGRL